jgi:hypothetical protein
MTDNAIIVCANSHNKSVHTLCHVQSARDVDTNILMSINIITISERFRGLPMKSDKIPFGMTCNDNKNHLNI